MKKILTSMVACACLVGFSACDSFLDEEPKSQLTTNSYYLSEAHAQQNVNYLYRTGVPSLLGATGAYAGSMQQCAGFLTGYLESTYAGQELHYQYAMNLERQNWTQNISGNMDGIWDACYKAINVANNAIKNIPEINMDATKAASLIAEAKFFRAWNYFYLVKWFGDVPFYTEPSSVETLRIPRTSKATIYAQIEQDLKDAMNVLPSGKFYANGNRATKAAAAMILTDVYMTQSKYADAATAVKPVLSSGHALTQHGAEFDLANYDATKLNSAYNILREEDGLDESIYSYEYDGSISNGGRWTAMAFDSGILSAVDDVKYSIAERIYGPADRYLNIYEANDLRLQPNQFFHWEYTYGDKTWKAKDGKACAWFFFKHSDFHETGVGTKDRDLYRYAEALLFAAEATAQSGSLTEAAGYLAEVKARANMEGKTAAQIAAELPTDKDAFIKEVWNERLRELIFDFKIWDDCVRTGMFPNISATERGKITYEPLVGAQNGNGKTFKESDLLWPISINEIQRNPELTQNPGYATN